MALNKEIWVGQIKENFYPKDNFLKKVVDYSVFTDGHKLHLPSTGIDPKVLINNNTYPIEIVQRADQDNEFTLDKFETENGLVIAPDAVEYSYDKVESVVRHYRNVLRLATAKKAIHAFAPLKDTPDTPVLEVTGETRNGRKTLSLDDILTLKERFDDAVIDPNNRFIVLHPKHVSDLLRQDTKLFKEITDLKNGEPFKFAGFGIFTFNFMPTYRIVENVLTKVSFGADAEENDVFASIAFQAGEVFKADGEINMYESQNDPHYRGTIVGFDKRFIAAPIRGKGVGALVSKADAAQEE